MGGIIIIDGKISVLIIDDNAELCSLLKSYLDKDERFNVIGCAYDGEAGFNDILTKQPDIVILDIILPERDGISILEDIRTKKDIKRPVFIALTAVGQEKITRRMLELGANYVVLKPFSMEILVKRMIEQYEMHKDSPIETIEIETKPVDKEEYVSEILQRVGIPINLKGYTYLKTAIKLSLDNEELLESITKLLYPAVATECGSTSSRVERDIRHSLEVAWNKGNGHYYYEFIGYKNVKNDKPTNGAFVSSIVEKSRNIFNKKNMGS